jgi:hypothetical protein
MHVSIDCIPTGVMNVVMHVCRYEHRYLFDFCRVLHREFLVAILANFLAHGV